MSTRRGAPPPAGAGGRTPLHGIGGRNPLVLLAGGGAAVVLVVAMVRRGSGSSTSGSTTQVPNTYDTTLSDIEAQWENQFEALQNQIAAQTPVTGMAATQTYGPIRLQGPNPPRSTAPPMRSTLAMPALTAPAVNSAVARNTAATPAPASSAGFAATYVTGLRSTARR